MAKPRCCKNKLSDGVVNNIVIDHIQQTISNHYKVTTLPSNLDWQINYHIAEDRQLKWYRDVIFYNARFTPRSIFIKGSTAQFIDELTSKGHEVYLVDCLRLIDLKVMTNIFVIDGNVYYNKMQFTMTHSMLTGADVYYIGDKVDINLNKLKL